MIIDELIVIENGEQKFVDSADNKVIDVINYNGVDYHFAKENEVTNGVCDNAVAEPIIDMQVMGNSIQNGTPTPEVPIEIESVGEKSKNLFNKNKITKGKNLNANTGGLYDSATRGVSDYIPVCANQTYNVDFGIGYQNFINQNSTPYSVLYNSDLTFNSQTAITRTTTGYYFTSPINGFIRLNFYIDMEDYVQLEVGSTVTEYEPYGYKIPVKVSNNTEEITTNIYLNEPLRKVGDYADYVDFKNQKLYRTIGEYSFKGTEKFAISGSTTEMSLVCYTADITPTPKIRSKNGFCNIGNVGSVDQMGNYDNGFFYNSNPSHFLKIQKSVIPNYSDSLTDVEKVALFKEYLASLYSAKTPVNILYELKEPTEETIELPEIATLDGTTIFNVETTIKPSEFNVTYWRQITP